MRNFLPLWAVRAGFAVGVIGTLGVFLVSGQSAYLVVLTAGAIWDGLFLFDAGWWAGDRNEDMSMGGLAFSFWIAVVASQDILYLSRGDLRSTSSGLANVLQWVVGIVVFIAAMSLHFWGSHASGRARLKGWEKSRSGQS